MAGPDRFYFTVSDLGRFLGKSPVTLRGWERKGLITFARDSGNDRKLTAPQVREAAEIARQLGRIDEERLRLVGAAVTLLEMIEKENS
jgi:predicted site-specific integrase-resolvase